MAYKTFANGFPLPASDLNNYLMNQSVIVFADAAARTAAIASPTEGMVTYLEDDNELYKWTGSAWVNVAPTPDLTSLIPKSTVTTAGDLIIADGASSVTRLGIGAADTVLTSNGTTATWEAAGAAGSMTLLSTTTLSGSFTTVTGISQAYKNLHIIVDGFYSTSGGDVIYISFKDSGGTTLPDSYLHVYSTGSNPATAWYWTDIYLGLDVSSASSQSGSVFVDLYDYSSTRQKSFATGGNGNKTNNRPFIGGGGIGSNTPIEQVRIELGSGSFSGGTMYIYGVN